MKTTGIALMALVLALCWSACHKKDTPRHRTVPYCIQRQISDYHMACEHGASVKRYLFRNREVYAFDPGTCGADMTTDIYDRNCNYLGSLGGIAGNSQIEDENFMETATYLGTVWTN